MPKSNKPARGTIGYEVDKLAKRYGSYTIGLTILEMALVRATGTSGVRFCDGNLTNLFLHETPEYVKHRLAEKAIFDKIEQEYNITVWKSSDPHWPYYGVGEKNQDTRWFKTREEAETYANDRASKRTGAVVVWK